MRNEIKIPVNKNFDLNVKKWRDFNKNCTKEHNDRLVNSIYYDTDNMSSAMDNLVGISSRKKYRIRWYDLSNDKFHYEIKIKKNNLGKKITLNSNQDFKEVDNFFSFKNSFLKKKENKFFLEHVNELDLKPVIKISYVRSYFLYDRKIRITYDRNIKYDFLNKFQLKTQKLEDHMNVLEIKFDPENSLLASNLMKNMNINPKRFSKYLRGLYLFDKVAYI